MPSLNCHTELRRLKSSKMVTLFLAFNSLDSLDMNPVFVFLFTFLTKLGGPLQTLIDLLGKQWQMLVPVGDTWGLSSAAVMKDFLWRFFLCFFHEPEKPYVVISTKLLILKGFDETLLMGADCSLFLHRCGGFELGGLHTSAEATEKGSWVFWGSSWATTSGSTPRNSCRLELFQWTRWYASVFLIPHLAGLFGF